MKKMLLKKLGLLIMLSLAAEAYAVVSERYSLGERFEASSAVMIVSVTNNENIDDDWYMVRSRAEVLESSEDSLEGKEIWFYRLGMVDEDVVKCCGVGKVYLVYAKPYKDGFQSAAKSHGAYEVLNLVPWFLDERSHTVGRFLAEQILVLHRLHLRTMD